MVPVAHGLAAIFLFLVCAPECSGHAPAPRATPSKPYVPQAMARTASKPLVVLPMMYGAAAAQLANAAWAAVPGPFMDAMLASTALALLCDFGPSAVRDVSTSIEAQATSVLAVMDASPNQILIDNFVHNLSPADDEMVALKEEAVQRLSDVNAWSALVRFRVAADALGVWLLHRGTYAGAAVLLAAHSIYWSSGGASARVDRFGNRTPLPARFARLMAVATASLALSAAVASLGQRGSASRLQSFAGWAYSVGLALTQLTRIVAGRVQATGRMPASEVGG